MIRVCRVTVALICSVLCLVALSAKAELDAATRAALNKAINGEHRSADAKARDAYRKPLQALSFLGFRSDMTVVEIWPGAGWYTQILAPALQKDGKLYAAAYSANGPFGYQRRSLGKLLSTLGSKPDLYRDTTVTTYQLPYELDIAPRGSADMVLSIRNVHNLVSESYSAGRHADLAFQVMFELLKPGGILGIIDHRWPDPATEDTLAKNGYISIERTVQMAEAAGFKLADQSELLANPKDTHEHPQGVWTLMPTLALGDKDRDKYLAIGESDRFLLKFLKPKAE